MVNWMAEGRGAYAFTNEMFNPGMYFQRDIADPDTKRLWFFPDKMEFGQFFTPYKEFNHPQYGKVLLGGMNKWSSRVTPTSPRRRRPRARPSVSSSACAAN